MIRSFIIKVVLFLLPLIVFAFAMESFVRTIPNSYSYKKQWMEEHRDSVETLILGNSHMYAAIDPSLLKNAFNLSNSAQSFEIDYWLLSKYINKCPRLKTVLICIDNKNLYSPELETINNVWNRVIYYSLYMNYSKHRIFSRYYYELSCPLFACKKFEKVIFSFLFHNPYKIECDSLGRGTYYKRQNEDSIFRSERKIVSLINKTDISTIQAGINYNYPIITDIIKKCHDNNIRLIMLSTPYLRNYNIHLNKEQMRPFYQVICDLKKKYNVDYCDYREDERFVTNERLFKDESHLSDEGAMLFTNILKNDKELE